MRDVHLPITTAGVTRVCDESPAAIADVIEDGERGGQWLPIDEHTAFAPPFGTIRQCRVCGCLVAGGPTACVRCAEAGA